MTIGSAFGSLGMFWRAVLYLIRKKGKALLILMIFFLVSVLLLTGFSILEGTSLAARELRSNIGAAIALRPYKEMTVAQGTLKEGETPVISEESIEAAAEVLGEELKAYNTEHYGYAKGDGLHFIAGSGDSEASSMGRVTAVRTSRLMDAFLGEEYTLAAGRHIEPEDENKILISTELAAENGLAVGDVITLTHAELAQQNGVYVDAIAEKTAFVQAEIIGIFQGNAAGESADTPTAGKTANHILADSHLLVHLQEQQEGVYEGSVTFYIAAPLALEEMLQKIEAIDSIDWSNHILRENDFAYEQLSGQLERLQRLTIALIIAASALSVIILMLLLLLGIRGRVREAGIYLSIGQPRAKILGQLALENGILLVLGFALATLVFLLCCGPLNDLLFNDIIHRSTASLLPAGGGQMLPAGGGQMLPEGIAASLSAGGAYLCLDGVLAMALLAGEAGAAGLVLLGAGSAIFTLKPKEILSRMS